MIIRIYNLCPYGVHSQVEEIASNKIIVNKCKIVTVTSTCVIKTIMVKYNFVKESVKDFLKYVMVELIARGKVGERAFQ